MGEDSKVGSELQGSAIELEVSRFLKIWWDAIYQMKRGMWLIVPLLIAYIVGGLKWAPVIGCVMLPVGAWWMWPAFRIMLIRGRRPLSVVLWVRRFHRGSGSRALLRLWLGAAGPWAQLITLADNDVRGPVSAIWLVVLICILGPPAEMLLFRRGIGSHFLLFSSIVCGVTLLMGTLFIFAITKRSVAKLRSREEVDRVLHQVQRIRSEKILLWSLGSGVVRCPRDDDEVWRDAICKLAPEVSVVIVDYGTVPSENIEWEVNTLLRICGPGKLIVALPYEAKGSDDGDAFGGVDSVLQTRFALIPKAQTIFYPRSVPMIAISKRFEAMVRPAQKMIGMAALSARSRVPGSGDQDRTGEGPSRR